MKAGQHRLRIPIPALTPVLEDTAVNHLGCTGVSDHLVHARARVTADPPAGSRSRNSWPQRNSGPTQGLTLGRGHPLCPSRRH